MNKTDKVDMTKEQQVKIDREVEFLKQLHQAAQMGRDTLEHVNGNIGPGELRNAVESARRSRASSKKRAKRPSPSANSRA